ncbi:hypothetical protein OHR68_16635 [Spirillospora sp. NBC_00431]
MRPVRCWHRFQTVLRLIESTPALRARLHVKREEIRERVAAALLDRAFTALSPA